jgi:hypothetical protein
LPKGGGGALCGEVEGVFCCCVAPDSDGQSCVDGTSSGGVICVAGAGLTTGVTWVGITPDGGAMDVSGVPHLLQNLAESFNDDPQFVQNLGM